MEKNKYIEQKNNDLELYCSVLLIPLVFCTVANYTFNSLFGGYVLFAVYVFSFACLLIFNRRQKNIEFDIKALLAFFCFDFVYLFINLISYNTNGLFAIAFFSVAVLYALGVVYNATNFKMLKYISIVSLISVSISVVLSLIVLVDQPGASRILASQSFDIYGRDELVGRGLAGFGVMYSLIFFIPIIFYWLKKVRKKYNILMLLCVIVIIINIVLSGYTTALILTVLVIVFYILSQMKSYPKLFCIIALIILALFQSLFLPDFLYYISDFFGSKQMAEHLIEIADILAGKSSVFDLGRTNLLKQSWEAFLNNPLFGGYVSGESFEVSGHSTFFDILGSTGLVGSVLYCLFLYLFHRQVKEQINNPLTKKVWTVESIIFFLLQILNPILVNYEIVYAYMCIAPASLLYIDMLGEKQSEDCTN